MIIISNEKGIALWFENEGDLKKMIGDLTYMLTREKIKEKEYPKVWSLSHKNVNASEIVDLVRGMAKIGIMAKEEVKQSKSISDLIQ